MPHQFKCFLLLFIFLLPSCTLFPRQTITSPPTREYSYKELLQALDSRSNIIESIEGRISSKIIINGDSNASRQLLVLKKPAFIRMDILTPFGSPALTMATDGEFLDLQYHSENRFFSGQADDRSLSGLLSSSLNISDLARVLSGDIPLISFDEAKSTVSMEKEGYRLTVKKGKAKQEILLESKRLYPLEGIIYGDKDKVLLSIRLNKYKKVKSIEFPTSIDLSIPLENYEMRIRYLDVALNEYTGMNAFQLTPPEGTLVENLNNINF
ncbi:MAG: DUF4292 domain-containing protein [Deltaproteobacteria bacterium]|nr:DUF4292 domain-containing protein [Deltaproteobacteria bacterium]